MANKQRNVRFKPERLRAALGRKRVDTHGDRRKPPHWTIQKLVDEINNYADPQYGVLTLRSFQHNMQMGFMNPYILDIIARLLDVDFNYLTGNVEYVEMDGASIPLDEVYQDVFPPYGTLPETTGIDKNKVFSDLCSISGLGAPSISDFTDEQKEVLLNEMGVMLNIFDGYILGSQRGGTPLGTLESSDRLGQVRPRTSNDSWEDVFYDDYILSLQFRTEYFKNPAINVEPICHMLSMDDEYAERIKYIKNFENLFKEGWKL